MDKKDIDKLFRDKLGDFRELPHDKVWRSIEKSLDQRKKSRRVIPIWWKMGGAAAILIIGLLIWNLFEEAVVPSDSVITDSQTEEAPSSSWPGDQSTDNTEPNTYRDADTFGSQVADSESDIREDSDSTPGKKESGITGGSLEINGIQRSDVGVVAADQDISQDADPAVKDIEEQATAGTAAESNEALPSEEIRQNEFLIDKNEALADKAGADKEKTPELNRLLNEVMPEEEDIIDERALADNSEKKSIFDEINEAEAVAEEETGPKWSVGPSVAPVYFNSFGDGSPIHSNFASNSKSGNINLSYGLAVSYDVSRKLSLRSGLHKVNYGYNTNDISFSSSLIASTNSEITNINYNSNSRNLVVQSNTSRPNSGDFAANDIVAPTPSRNGRMVQEFGYLEVPFELNYTLLDRKLSVNLIGGFSSLFLVDNSVSLEASGTTTEMGEANNLNDMNFSSNIGLGVNYNFSKTMKVYLEPMFKYQMNMFSEVEGDFQPYTVGVYTGMSFKF